jgi:hypothetical protein
MLGSFLIVRHNPGQSALQKIGNDHPDIVKVALSYLPSEYEIDIQDASAVERLLRAIHDAALKGL